MALSSGTRLGPYEILAALGAGGMGEVYRARDTKLNRDVALKLLPVSFTHDPERLARFRREAQVLASLNHPHIAAIYGLDEADGAQFLSLELVDGESLDRRLARGRLPMHEALAIARQIAEALEAAHEKGIIHRDLKPANVALTADGTVKVLDFGLAKTAEAAAASSRDMLNSPTLTSPAMLSGVGMIVGTAAYMSPEQASGKPVDKRADIWSFGVVLWEMLSGRRLFDSETVSHTLADVLRAPIDLTALPNDAPPAVHDLVRRCLDRDVKSRLRDIGEARIALSNAARSERSHVQGGRRTASWVKAVALAVLAVGGLTALGAKYLGSGATERASETRFILTPSADQRIDFSRAGRPFAIAPNGEFIVYVAQDQVVVRWLARVETSRISGIANARDPFVSPDGQWIAYFGPGGIRKVSVSGGTPATVCRIEGSPGGGTWLDDDTIVFATDRGLYQVPATGGDASAIPMSPARATDAVGGAVGLVGGLGFISPTAVPGRRAVLFTVQPTVRAVDAGQVAVLDLQTGRYTVVLRGVSSATGIARGFVVYAARGTLHMARFDPSRLEIVGTPTTTTDTVLQGRGSVGQYALSRTGTLVYVAGGGADADLVGARSIIWVDGAGHETDIGAPPRDYGVIRLSPDESRIAVDVRGAREGTGIWIWDIDRRALTRLTINEYENSNPVWTADGRRIVFRSNRNGGFHLFSQFADGRGSADQMTSSDAAIAKSATADGRFILFTTNVQPGILDIAMTRTDGSTPQIDRLISTGFVSNNPDVSPDVRWLAYQSNESGNAEVYVRPFPSVNDGRWQVSSTGGTNPLWSRDGRKLYFFDGNGLLTSVDVQAGEAFRASAPTRVLNVRYSGGAGARTYDVSRSGRFLMMKDAVSSDEPSASLVVAVNWLERK